MFEELNLPRTFNLLYRASEHYFSIEKFHQACDHVYGTLTIYKTEYGNIIAGYTPLNWAHHSGRDTTNSSFMMAVTHKQRLNHTAHGQSAIWCDPKLGPSFGGLFNKPDLRIFKYNHALHFETRFPSAYNWNNFFTPG